MENIQRIEIRIPQLPPGKIQQKDLISIIIAILEQRKNLDIAQYDYTTDFINLMRFITDYGNFSDLPRAELAQWYEDWFNKEKITDRFFKNYHRSYDSVHYSKNDDEFQYVFILTSYDYKRLKIDKLPYLSKHIKFQKENGNS